MLVMDHKIIWPSQGYRENIYTQPLGLLEVTRKSPAGWGRWFETKTLCKGGVRMDISETPHLNEVYSRQLTFFAFIFLHTFYKL